MAAPGGVDILGKNQMVEYLMKCGIRGFATYSDGALLNPVMFAVGAVEAEGAVLFADLPGFSTLATNLSPVECACYASHFFAWFEGEAGRRYGGIVDKFIGDEVMMVFPRSKCEIGPLEAALRTASAMLAHDPYAFEPKIGIAAGPFAIALTGTHTTRAISAVGHTVNLAARCVQAAREPKTIKVATDDLELIARVFQDQVNDWEVSGPSEFEPKNMAPVQVVHVRRKPMWIPNFDFLADVREMVALARKDGAVLNDSAGRVVN